MTRKGLLAVVVGVLLAASQLGAMSWASSRTSRPELGNGFRVAPGTRLLGGVFPNFPNGAAAAGWTAYLWVDTDAVTAINRYATQAAALGFRGPPIQCGSKPVPSISSSEGTTNPTGFVCDGRWTSESASLQVTVTVCEHCDTPTSLAVLALTEGGAANDAPLAARYAGSTARLSEQARQRARRATPGVDEAFTDQLTTAEFPRVVARSAAAAPSFSLGRCTTGDAEAILTANRDNLASVIDALVKQNRSGDIDRSDPLSQPRSAAVGDVSVTRVRYGYYTEILTVEDPSRSQAFLLIEWCND